MKSNFLPSQLYESHELRMRIPLLIFLVQPRLEASPMPLPFRESKLRKRTYSVSERNWHSRGGSGREGSDV